MNAIEAIEKIQGVKVDYHAVMPTHLHFILVLQNCCLPLGEIVRRFKSTVSRQVGFKLWQPNYYEHIIRNQKALGKIREYIRNNPLVERIQYGEFY